MDSNDPKLEGLAMKSNPSGYCAGCAFDKVKCSEVPCLPDNLLDDVPLGRYIMWVKEAKCSS